MKAIILVLIFVITPVLVNAQGLEIFSRADQEVTMTTVGDPPTEKELQGQKKLKKYVEEALKKMEIPNIAIDIIFADDVADTVYATSSRGVKMWGKVQPISLRAKRSVILKGEDVIIEHIAFHEVAHIKNGDFYDSLFPIELEGKERERRAEYTAFKHMGWKRYREYWIAGYYMMSEEERSSVSLKFILESKQKELGIYPQE